MMRVTFPIGCGLGAAFALMLSLPGCKPPPPPAPPPPDVEVVDVLRKDEPIRAEWIGTLDGSVNAEIRAEVSGYILRQGYKDGAPVHKGDVLFQIDPRPFQAAYDQVKATYDKATLDLRRQSELIQKGAISQEEYDNAVQTQLADKAALEQAELSLGFTRIVSPIDGIAGIAAAQLGDLVGPGTGILTTVSTVDPIRVYFPISERTYLDFKAGRADEPRFPEGIELELVLTDGSVYPLKGRIYAADRAIDAGTGTLRIAGEFPNPDLLLRPGQYARIRAVVRTERGALLVPQRAVAELQGGYQVATVDADNHAHVRDVKVGVRDGPLWVVEEGLSPGDRVIAEGFQKVREGSLVVPHPFKAAR
jgi:membrane fusion protein, multidrug efflux system